MQSKFKKSLRLSQTEVESILWYRLRNRQLNGFKFRRQHILKEYIVDFVCLKKTLIVELDGSQHAAQINYDAIRTKKLEADGLRLIRFWNNEIVENVESVLQESLNALHR